ncbi:serine/threonine-protein kinase [Micromonospora sp. CPCC 206061]|uniref:serine/threonine-protein kinase n=1 Tax=Micromonospora sp. CPCC 206061 TaxID=3122410 RepID=UPI002FF18F5D
MDSGDLLGERYRLGERVATGGMGEVWRATDVLLDRAVAVKVLRPGLVAEPGFTERFRSEARTLAGLHHPNVVSVYDYGEGDTTYLVMAYVEGEPLSERIEAAGRLDVAETVSIVTQAAAALHAVHLKGVVHRDVKPGNLLIQPNATVVLVDFGVARSAAAGSVTKTHEVIGTALYMAPEQVSKKPLSPATDVYALGAVAYHCLAGRPPYEGENALQVALQRLEGEPDPLPDDVPEGVRAVVTRAMAREPEDRYPNAEALADAMRAAGGGATTALLAGASGAAAVVPGAAARPGGPATTASFPAAHTGSRYRKWWALGGALLVGAVAAAAIALLPDDDGGGGENPGPGDVPSSQAVVTDDAGSPTRRPAGRTTAPTQSASPSASPSEAATSAPATPEPTEGEDDSETEAPTSAPAVTPEATAAATPAP